MTGSYTYIGLDGLLYFKSYQYVREGFKPYVSHFQLGHPGIGGFFGSGSPNLMPEKEKEKETNEIDPKLLLSLG